MTDKPSSWSKETKALIKKTVAKGIPDADLELFEHVCLAKGLDPLQKEIYAIRRGNNWTMEASIHGLLKLCAPHLAGIQTTWYDNQGAGTDVWMQDGSPKACKATVWRKGCDHPFEAAVRYSDFAGGNLWAKMGSVMIRKVAITHALRFGFADLIGGLYESAEMDQADNPPSSVPATVPNSESEQAQPKPVQRQAPRTTAPTPQPQVDQAQVEIVTAQIDPAVKADLTGKLGALQGESQQRVVLAFKERAGIPAETPIGPDHVKTVQHGEILLELLAQEEIPF